MSENIERLDAIEARANAATEGPWTTSGPDTVGQWVIYDKEWAVAEAKSYNHNMTLSNRPEARGPAYIDPDANAEFIAHARADVPYLLALARKQQAAIEAVCVIERRLERSMQGEDREIAEDLRAALEAAS